MSPRVSILTPTYNGAAHVGATIESVLAQTMADWELVIVDDCSKDDTREVVAGYADPRLRLIALEQNLGPVGARNRAMAEAHGEHIAALDQDDLCHPQRLEKQVAYLDAHPEVALVSCAVGLIGEGAANTSPFLRGLTPPLIDWLLLQRNPLVWSSVMLRGSAARRLDPFERLELRYAEDFDLYQRIRAFGTLAQLEDELLLYRCHAGGASKRYPEQMAANARRIVMEAHARLLGEASEADADMLLRHVMLREPFPDVATLGRLTDLIGRLYPAFVGSRELDAAALDAIDADVSRLWWETGRAAVRSGTLPLKAAMATLPREVTRHLGNKADLMVSGLVGKVRAMRS